jgi:uncharacterized phiE125 gp8 family phage protein
MIPIRVTGPAVEPVGLAEMRAHLRLDGTEEDELIASLVAAARHAVEAAARRVLVAQTWRIVVDRVPSGRRLRLPLAPLIAVERLAVADAAGVLHELLPALAAIERNADPPCLSLDAAVPDPGTERGGIEIDARFGFGPAAADVPEPLRLAVKLLAARFFEHRGDGLGDTLPAQVDALLAPFRRVRV